MSQGATQSLGGQLRKRWILMAYRQLNSSDLSRDLDVLWSASRAPILSWGYNLNREYCGQKFQKFGYPVAKNNIRLACWKNILCRHEKFFSGVHHLLHWLLFSPVCNFVNFVTWGPDFFRLPLLNLKRRRPSSQLSWFFAGLECG